MTKDNSDFAIPITKDCVFALRLDIEKDIEHAVIGEREEVMGLLRGMSEDVFVDEKRIPVHIIRKQVEIARVRPRVQVFR